MNNIKFSLKGKGPEILRAFVREHELTNSEVDNSEIIINGYPYTIIFDDIKDGIVIMENLPCRVLVSFQTHQNGLAYAVIRLIRSKERQRK